MEIENMTPEGFVTKHLPTVRQLFPDIAPTEMLKNAEDLTYSQSVSDIIRQLEDHVWKIMEDDPILQKLGRKAYDKLPQEKKLQLLEDSINLLNLAQQADQYLNKAT